MEDETEETELWLNFSSQNLKRWYYILKSQIQFGSFQNIVQTSSEC
jgi:hypothetical protein